MAHSAEVLKDTEGQTHPLPRTIPGVQPQVFAGRLGGNQRFAVSSSDPDYSEIVAKEPDAGRQSSWKALLDLRAFYEPDLWRLATIEGIGTMLQTFISGLLAVGLVPTATETSVGPVFTVSLAALVNIFMITLFIYTAGPITNAHFNPLITMGTFFAKLSSLPRTLLYILFQCTGAVVRAFLARASLGASARELAVVPGCYVDTAIVTPGQAYAFETMASLTILFLAFGLGLDPRNSTTFGPALAPFLIGFSVSLTLFAGGIARKGYLAASSNPARCLGLMSAAQRFDYHYIHWVGDISAALINGLLYAAVPPYKR